MTGKKGYVSRGALKLKRFLNKVPIDFKEKVVLDIGSSHGGFTQVVLLQGAKKIYCVDVGKGLLDWKLRNFENIIVMEGINARELKKENFEQLPDIGIVDVSFISLKKILPVVFSIAKKKIIALIKPQFEATYKETSKGKGIIKDKKIHKRVINDIKKFVKDKRWKLIGVYPCEVKGSKGNQEYFIYYERI
ncbi:MAG: SAM-dependent methyltransferase [Elusimicrobiota bacterium]